MTALVLCLTLANPPSAIPLIAMDKVPYTLVEVDLGAYGKTKMIVDTGASETVLAQWFTEQAKIPTTTTEEKGTDSGGEQFRTLRAAIKSYGVGARTIKTPFLYVVPTPPQFNQFGIGGILSPQHAFTEGELLIDSPHRQMAVGPEAVTIASNMKLVAEFPIKPCSKDMQNKYVATASINGAQGIFYLDTGGRRSAATQTFVSKLGNLSGEKDQRSGAASTRTVEKLSAMKLVLGTLETSIDLDVEPRVFRVPRPTASSAMMY